MPLQLCFCSFLVGLSSPLPARNMLRTHISATSNVYQIRHIKYIQLGEFNKPRQRIERWQGKKVLHSTTERKHINTHFICTIQEQNKGKCHISVSIFGLGFISCAIILFLMCCKLLFSNAKECLCCDVSVKPLCYRSTYLRRFHHKAVTPTKLLIKLS